MYPRRQPGGHAQDTAGRIDSVATRPGTNRTRREITMRVARRAPILAVPLVALVLAGCGSPPPANPGPGGGRSGGPASPAADPGQRALQFARCMREHGV